MYYSSIGNDGLIRFVIMHSPCSEIMCSASLARCCGATRPPCGHNQCCSEMSFLRGWEKKKRSLCLLIAEMNDWLLVDFDYFTQISLLLEWKQTAGRQEPPPGETRSQFSKGRVEVATHSTHTHKSILAPDHWSETFLPIVSHSDSRSETWKGSYNIWDQHGYSKHACVQGPQHCLLISFWTS